MINNYLQDVENAFENRDLSALNALAVPSFRIINKSKGFSSVLMLSCNNIKHLSKINSLDADCIILNLEDAVSKQDKPFALVLCAIFLSLNKQSSKKLVVRVNALDEGGYEEIVYLNQFMPDAIRVPKIKTQEEVKQVFALINDECELHLSIETKEAWYNLSQLKVHKRVTTFYLGVLDLFADMGLNHSLINKNNPTMLYILSHFLISCRSMDVKAVSFVYQKFKNLEIFSEWISLEKSMGYDCKACISPKQVELVNKIFENQEDLITRAKTIVKLFEMHESQGITGFVDDEYGFIDEPVYKGALVLLETKS
ncbi:MAG: hypothetical protein COA33_007310 [Fluviicola sp.]|nr:hypothetical protein [Fluviicola sp.]